MESICMEGMEIREVLKSLPPVEIVSLVESILFLDCLKDPLVRESILQYEEQEDAAGKHITAGEAIESHHDEIEKIMKQRSRAVPSMEGLIRSMAFSSEKS